MRAGRAGGDHGAVGTLEPVLDRDIARCHVDDAAGNEERRHPARSTLLQEHAGVGNATGAADAGTDHHPSRALILVTLRLPAGVVERLLGRAHRIDDELVDLALLFRLHPLVGIVGAIGAIAARDLAGDARAQIGDIDALDAADSALAVDQAPPGGVDAASERRHHPQSCDYDASHLTAPSQAGYRRPARLIFASPQVPGSLTTARIRSGIPDVMKQQAPPAPTCAN